MHLRKAEEKDKKDIFEIINIMRLDVPDFVWADIDFIDKQIKKGEYFLAEVEGKVVGVISLRQRRKKMYIETLAVPEKYRRRGIGAQLIEFAKKFAREKNLKILCACSFLEYNAKDFYFKQGFSLSKNCGAYNSHKFNYFETKIEEC